jgi:thymidylate synthase
MTDLHDYSIVAPPMDPVWLGLLHEVIYSGRRIAPRGLPTYEIIGSQITVSATRPIVTVAGRKMGYRFLAAEAAWILSGDDRLKTIVPFSKRMADFSDDGITLFGSYGKKLVEQLEYVVRTLRTDPDSRQAVVNIWREIPPKTKDVPCTLSVQFLIREGRLHAVVSMRSSDVWLGVPYDIPSAAMMAAYVFLHLPDRCDLALGNVYQTAGSRHLYERDLDSAKRLIHGHLNTTTYAPLDVSEFERPQALIDHLWAFAHQRPTTHRWLAEFRKEVSDGTTTG